MRNEVTKAAEMLNSLLTQQGFSYKKEVIRQTLEDFENSTMKEIQNDFDNNDFSDIEDLSKNVNVYIDLKNLINENSVNEFDYQIAHNKIIKVYEYYELKYIRELEHRNSDQRRNYIETILVPIILISLFFEGNKTNINQ